ncbi:MAG: glycosyltransferase family 4 protein [Patescibacteria group bacterium]|nr:glycosyltransferase family 4 protein [Patescibacteria group bacterium]
MRVLIAAGIYPPDSGGPAVHAKAQFEGFPKLSAQTGLVALAHYRRWPRGIRHFFYFLALLRKTSRYEIVYAHDAVGAGIPALIAARFFSKKFVVRIGGDLAWEHKAAMQNISLKEWYAKGEHKKDRMFKLSRWLMRHADMVVVPSPLLVELYITHYGLDKQKLRFITNPFPSTNGYVSNTERTIIWASRLTSYKNLDTAIKALAPILREKKDLKLIIMGDGPEKERLQTLSQSLGMDANVIFTGAISQEEVLKKTSQCLFAIAPALTEFNPNYILQGISFGKPFIISREHGLPFEVPEFLKFDARSDVDLREKITRLLTEERYREASKFIKSIDVSKNWDDNLRENYSLLQALLNGSK